MKHLFTALLMASAVAIPTQAQDWLYTDEVQKAEPLNNIRYKGEMQASFSKGHTPLWLNANKHGLSSLDKTNGYMRVALERPLQTDSARRWGLGYCLDVVAPLHYTSNVVVQQAYVEGRWLHGALTVGSKQWPMELKNNRLSSGSQTLGINARPVPQVRLALPDYWTLPFAGGWLQLKGHIAYGMMTDDNWQHDFTNYQNSYADRVLYHSKAGYLRIGRDEDMYPFSVEMGLEMACEFGGTPHVKLADGNMIEMPTGKGLSAFWHAFILGGQDTSDGVYGNMEGNQLGSWVMRLNYNADTWRLGVYADHFFEDHSQMFLLDYNGYGTGEEWNVRKDRRFYVYQLKDIMLGAELNLKYGTWLKNVVFEYLFTKYQSGPYNHDRTSNIPDHMAGLDDYYNHGNYTGWQHWGQVIGNPLYRSPIYNDNGVIRVLNNRFVAFHLGFDGNLSSRLSYRVLATWQKGWGTYAEPFTKAHQNASFMVEGAYRFNPQWNVTAAYGMDFGSNQMLGHNAGLQITVSHTGLLKTKANKKGNKR